MWAIVPMSVANVGSIVLVSAPDGRMNRQTGVAFLGRRLNASETSRRRLEMMRFPWLDYDMIALVVLGFAISSIALVAFNI
jgi:hypothetical protein